MNEIAVVDEISQELLGFFVAGHKAGLAIDIETINPDVEAWQSAEKLPETKTFIMVNGIRILEIPRKLLAEFMFKVTLLS